MCRNEHALLLKSYRCCSFTLSFSNRCSSYHAKHFFCLESIEYWQNSLWTNDWERWNLTTLKIRKFETFSFILPDRYFTNLPSWRNAPPLTQVFPAVACWDDWASTPWSGVGRGEGLDRPPALTNFVTADWGPVATVTSDSINLLSLSALIWHLALLNFFHKLNQKICLILLKVSSRSI